MELEEPDIWLDKHLKSNKDKANGVNWNKINVKKLLASISSKTEELQNIIERIKLQKVYQWSNL